MYIPEFIFYNHTMYDVLVNDHKAHLNLKKIAKAVKKDKKILKSLVELMLDGQIKIPQEWPNTSDIITLVSLSLAGICFVLCIKVRKMCITLLILKEMHHASSQNVPSFIYRKSSSEAALKETSDIGHCFGYPFNCIISIIQISVAEGVNYSIRVNLRWKLCYSSYYPFITLSFILCHNQTNHF